MSLEKKHDDWVKAQQEAGWRYGRTYQAARLRDPLCKEFHKLPKDVQEKLAKQDA